MNWKSTKFFQSVFIQVTGALALFCKLIDGGTYVALSTIALSIYSAADVVQRKIEVDSTEGR
jgi:hypothetical protein